jgi:hypothetical protein
VVTAAAELSKILRLMGRADLNDRTKAAAARASRPGTVVTVVGEFKQGKSSLVNGLLGGAVCPVDDDLATSAITLVSFGEPSAAMVRHRADGERKSTQIAVSHLSDWVSEIGNPGNTKQVERVEITYPSALLKSGLTIVDTPGMGGLGSGHAAATLSFLPFADGLILTSDASAELSMPEVEFLADATKLCPTVMLVLTKIDVYAEWERILEINREHLASRGVEIPMVAVSSELRIAALKRNDESLNEMSRFPQLTRILGSEIVAPAKANATERSALELSGIIAMLQSGLQSEKRILEDPAQFSDAMAELERAAERLEFLRGPAAKWSIAAGDSIADLSTTTTHEFRSRVRSIQRSMDERVEVLRTAEEWDEMVRDLQTKVAEAATSVFVGINAGRAAVYSEVAELLRDEALGVAVDSRGLFESLDVTELWEGKSDLSGADSTVGRGVRSALGLGQSFAGSQMMLGSISGLSQFGISLGVLASGPFLAGGFVLMGGMKVLDERKRNLAARRQTARQQIRQFIDDVQFDVLNEVSLVIRTTQRDLRDDFGERLSELQRTHTGTVQRAQQSAKSTQAESVARLATVEETMTSLDTIGSLL